VKGIKFSRMFATKYWIYIFNIILYNIYKKKYNVHLFTIKQGWTDLGEFLKYDGSLQQVIVRHTEQIRRLQTTQSSPRLYNVDSQSWSALSVRPQITTQLQELVVLKITTMNSVYSIICIK